MIIQNKSKEYQGVEFTLTNPSGKSIDSKRVGLEGRYRGDRKAEINVIPAQSGEFKAKVETDSTSTEVTWNLEKGGPGNREALLVNIREQKGVEVGKCVI